MLPDLLRHVQDVRSIRELAFIRLPARGSHDLSLAPLALGCASAYYGPFPIPVHPWNRYPTTSVQVCDTYHQLRTAALLLYTRLAEKRRSFPGELTVAR
jgi:hypothetical protein